MTRLYAILWYAAMVLALAGVVAWAVVVSSNPAEAGARSSRAHVEPLRYTADWPTECRRWINLPRAHEHGGNLREWADRVTEYRNSGTCVRITRRANSAAHLLFELHAIGHLCISPDARIGFHAVQTRDGRGGYVSLDTDAARAEAFRAAEDWFGVLFRQFPGLWEWYAAGPIYQTSVTYVSGEWFNARGVPEC